MDSLKTFDRWLRVPVSIGFSVQHRVASEVARGVGAHPGIEKFIIFLADAADKTALPIYIA